jgi:hypothetical protein
MMHAKEMNLLNRAIEPSSSASQSRQSTTRLPREDLPEAERSLS